MDIRLEILAFEQLLLEPETRKNDGLLEQLLAKSSLNLELSAKAGQKRR